VCQQADRTLKVNNDKHLMSAILNDMSGSFDGESQTASSVGLWWGLKTKLLHALEIGHQESCNRSPF
jgi:hypothetical protein